MSEIKTNLPQYDLEIKISPFNSDTWFLNFEDSYRFGAEYGTIYTFRLFSRDDCDAIENGPLFIENIVKAINHESEHLILLNLEGYEASKSFDNIAKNKENTEYLIE